MAEAEEPRSDELAVVLSDDGALVLGPAAELERFSDSTDSSPITPQLLQRAGQVLTGIEDYQKESGRWLKLDAESAAYLKRMGMKPGDIRAGVIRVKDTPRGAKSANGGALLKHVKFDKAGLLTPAAPMVLASMMQQMAVEKQMAQMQTYLERIDAKLDAVLRFQQDTLAGELDGVAETLAEAALVLEGTEKVTDTQWATVQHLNADLAKLQGRVLRHLTAVAERMAQSKTSPGKVKETFQKTNAEARFWLYELARTVQLQNQLYILQLNRVTAVEGDVSADYVAAVGRAREKRAARLLENLSGIARMAHELGSFSTFRKAIDWNSPRAVQEVNRFFAQLRDFADAANLAVEGTENLEPVRHIDAFRELTASSTNMAREAAGVAQQRTLEARETVANRARQAWGTTRSALEAATKGADNAPDKAESD
ncbi:hypothetical protein [Corynebacterium minutissimum]|uniref:Toxic anion resistance protein n=1 Tax=Corynebacterium minutissimum TaxID=38301 RepID=A0A2X4UL59_9CORY|nr:hypothetical protein [Corynebacterium minutissimum]KHO28679.1 hypothetical protein NX84_11025 [Corynebacterium minutissimum]QPS59645.1 hypothetical protein I6G51_12480 [Corynebacterium minutissimum]QQA79565.1 hypothetical protein I6H49_00370 [Corynebacterium minutissimum]SQH98664.1 Uncharacterised protein [Corynebacterium minutissimum]VEG06814.1 Uncharacterised protein [Corynebacterium minutissimum]